MRFLVVSNAPLISNEKDYFAYSPYEKEMEIWAKYVTEIAFCCPKWNEDRGLLISKIPFKIAAFFELKEFNVKSFWDALTAMLWIPLNFLIILRAMFWADHIHLRCPGNVGLLAAIAQLFFPNKIKTVKYAGNWDPNASAPFAYRLQKNILSHPFFSKNISVLVYGEWKNSTRNIKPFFTASYRESEKSALKEKTCKGIIRFVFVGMLTEGKQPLYALQLVEKLIQNGFSAEIYFFGEGIQRIVLEEYIHKYNLGAVAFLKGNQDANRIKDFFQESHFVILPSKSEGWPKVIAEGMFWGCVPIATSVSCIPFMLDEGNRGVLLSMNLQNDFEHIRDCIENDDTYQKKRNLAVNWSRNYTLDTFEKEIKLLLQS